MTAAYSRSVPARKRLTPHFRGAPRKEKGPPRRRRPPSYRLYRIGCRATSPARLRLRFQAAGRLAGVLALAGVLRSLAAGRHRGTAAGRAGTALRSEEHTSELQSLMRISYAVFCLKKKKQ